jgi:hypothetical protein
MTLEASTPPGKFPEMFIVRLHAARGLVFTKGSDEAVWRRVGVDERANRNRG